MKRLLLISFLLGLLSGFLRAQAFWEVETYPDEWGLQQRLAPMLARIAGQEFGERSLAVSRCPDTGLPVRTWAVEGETIISPYTGRAYIQGPTGYFGPKRRNDRGEIVAFGGDPLKYDLPPASAALLLDPGNARARAFLSIPGNLNQQYHFACKNWARFYPLLADTMGEAWRQAFFAAVDRYSEPNWSPSGNASWVPLSAPHNLVGEAGHLLGGNTIDGGTENHKTMWRTSCLVYAQLFPAEARISGFPVQEAGKRAQAALRDYLQRLLRTGNGEYDSSIYYPHTVEGFLNLYDFSADPENKALAKFALDYYFLTYGLKVVDGVIAGGQKRGHLPGPGPDEMETMLWAYFNSTSRDMSQAITGLHQTTSTYRPNEVIYAVATGKIDLPLEARMSRPFYHMDRFNAFQESFYRSQHFALGNVYMSIVDNPNQQIVWSLVTQGKQGALFFAGGQPYAQSEAGHSPYTQTVQSKGALLLLTAPTRIPDGADLDFVVSPTRVNPWYLPDTAQAPDFERANRKRYAAGPLRSVSPPPVWDAAAVDEFWKTKTDQAASWLWIPRGVDEQRWSDGRLLLRAGETLVAVTPLGREPFFVSPVPGEQERIGNRNFRELLRNYQLLVVPGEVSGYVIEAIEQSGFPDIDAFSQSLNKNTHLDTSRLRSDLHLNYRSLYGDWIEMQYRPEGLKAAARINGNALYFDNWADGAVYDSPNVKIKAGVLKVTDGRKGYQVDFRGRQPEYERQ